MSQLSGGRVACSCGHVHIQDQSFWIMTDCTHCSKSLLHFFQQFPILTEESSHLKFAGRGLRRAVGVYGACQGRVVLVQLSLGDLGSSDFWYFRLGHWQNWLEQRGYQTHLKWENAILWVTLISWFYQIVSTKNQAAGRTFIWPL